MVDQVAEKAGDSDSVDPTTESTVSGEKGVEQGQGQGQGRERRSEGLLLSSSGVSELVQRLKLQDRAFGEVSKALEQAAARLEKAKTG